MQLDYKQIAFSTFERTMAIVIGFVINVASLLRLTDLTAGLPDREWCNEGMLYHTSRLKRMQN